MSFTLNQSLITPVLTPIQHALHTDQSSVAWVMTAYLLSASVLTPIIGRIGDAVGKKKMLIVSMSALAFGSLVAALANNIEVMILARVIQGAGGGAMPLAFGIVRDEFPMKKVPGGIGLIASLAAASTGLGMVIAGPILEVLGFHWLFLLPMIVTSSIAIAAYFVIPPSRVRSETHIAWLPAVLLSAWLVALLLGVSQGPVWGWTSAPVIGLLVLAVVFAGLWASAESRVRVPLIDLKLMRMRAVWTTNLVALLIGVGMYAAFAFVPQFTQTPSSAGYGFGVSVSESGLMQLPIAAMTFVGGIVSPHLARWWEPRRVVVYGSFIMAGGLAWLALLHDDRWHIYVGNFLIGTGIGWAFSCLSAIVVTAVPSEQTGVASGMNTNIRTVGGSIGTALMSTVLASHLAASGLARESGYVLGFALVAIAVLGAAVAALFIPRPLRAASGSNELAEEAATAVRGSTSA